VVRTRVGYSGGVTQDPTYHNLGDHSETIQIDYNPAKISYEQLLDIFWQSHKPSRKAWSTQYKAAVFYHNEEQKRLALASRNKVAAALEGKIHTEIIRFTGFYLAEDYHQKYRLQQQGAFWREFKTIYPNMEDLVNSTAAARVNGYLDGYGSLEEIEAEVGSLGLSPEGEKNLVDIVKRSRTRWGLW
jgi:methionine-S-sulfoxide reductase